MSKANKTIEEKRRELDELLAWFEGDEFRLEEAVAKFEQADTLAKEIETELLEYKNTIAVLKQRFDE